MIKNIIIYISENRLKSILILILFYIVIKYLSLPNSSIINLEKGKITKTALMKQRVLEAKSKNKKYEIRQKWIPISRISRHVVNAVIISEDGTFYEHAGLDWYEIEESIEKNIKKGKLSRGGSTITQQLSKNLFLSTNKNFLRKFEEMIISLRIEKYLSKKRILEIYLNIIEFGNGIFGIEMASQIYFKKPSYLLTRNEAIQLVAIIPSPLKHNPNSNSKFVLRRTNIISNRMAARGW